mgnify:CR=1 FL=1
MELGDKEKRKLMAAAELVEKGDMAVLTKILEFEDILEDFKEEIDEKLAQKDTEIKEHKENIYSEMSSKMGEMLSEISVIKQDIEKMVKNDHMEAMHAKMMTDFDNKLKGFKSDLDLIRNSIPEMPESFDPTDVLNRISEVESKIPKIPEEITAYQIRDKLESIDNETEKLRIEAVHKLREELDNLWEELKKKGGRTMFGGGFNYSAMDLHIVDDETPTGTINSSNTVFTIKKAPNPVSSLKVYLNGARQRVSEDYTFSGTTITFTIAPPTGSILLVDYRH